VTINVRGTVSRRGALTTSSGSVRHALLPRRAGLPVAFVLLVTGACDAARPPSPPSPPPTAAPAAIAGGERDLPAWLERGDAARARDVVIVDDADGRLLSRPTHRHRLRSWCLSAATVSCGRRRGTTTRAVTLST